MNNNEDLLKHINHHLKKLKNTFVLGSGNNIKNYDHTSGWSVKAWEHSYGVKGYKKNVTHSSWQELNVGNTYLHPRIFPTSDFDPLNELRQAASEDEDLLEMDNVRLYSELAQQVIVSNHTRIGNCSDMAKYLAHNLWRDSHEDLHRIEVVDAKEFQHVFLVINRDLESDINKPNTWNALIVDPWVKNGVIFESSNYDSEMKKTLDHTMKQLHGFYAIGRNPGDAGVLLKYFFSSLIDKVRSFIPFIPNYFKIKYDVRSVYDIVLEEMPCPELEGDLKINIEDCYSVSPYEYQSEPYFISTIFDSNLIDASKEKYRDEKESHEEKYSLCMKELLTNHSGKAHVISTQQTEKTVDKTEEKPSQILADSSKTNRRP